MAVARHLLVPAGVSRCYHCLSRCVRKAFLCDDERRHRKAWIKQRLRELDQIFAIEIGGFAVMGNHLHLLVRTQPEWATGWSDEEVAARWLQLYPKVGQRLREANGVEDEREVIQRIVADRALISCWRQRLASLSWFMKCLKEPIARRANREDDVTGHFWEGRFKVQSLLDEAAILACLVYIDLNPVRAKVAVTPEESEYTSLRERLRDRQRPLTDGPSQGPEGRAPSVTLGNREREGSTWLIPIERQRERATNGREGLLDVTLDEYLRLVDITGRQAHLGKPDTAPPHFGPVLSRLDVDAERWLLEMLGHGRRIGTAVGSALSLAAEAARRGTKWVVGALPVQRSMALD